MKIEGIPDGWELVRIGRPFINERYISLSGKVTNCVCIPSGEAYAIVRKIKRPKKPKQYRPFANAAEFLAHPLNGDFLDAGHGFYEKVTKFNDNGIYFITDLLEKYDEAFCDYKFRDGTPFGIEVTE